MGRAARSLHPRQVHPPHTDRAAGQVIICCQSGKRNLGDHTEDGWDFDLAILMLAATLCVLGLGVLYLAERERPLTFALPAIAGTNDAAAAMSSILAAVSSGDATPGEAAEVSKLIDSYVRAVEATELHERITRLERAARQ